jgi:hypothetical protein
LYEVAPRHAVRYYLLRITEQYVRRCLYVYVAVAARQTAADVESLLALVGLELLAVEVERLPAVEEFLLGAEAEIPLGVDGELLLRTEGGFLLGAGVEFLLGVEAELLRAAVVELAFLRLVVAREHYLLLEGEAFPRTRIHSNHRTLVGHSNSTRLDQPRK